MRLQGTLIPMKLREGKKNLAHMLKIKHLLKTILKNLNRDFPAIFLVHNFSLQCHQNDIKKKQDR